MAKKEHKRPGQRKIEQEVMANEIIYECTDNLKYLSFRAKAHTL